jgi:hypothetical protein
LTTLDPAIARPSSTGCACGCVASPVVGLPASRSAVARARSAGRHLPLLPALALVLLPKCPLCVAAYLGILGSFGASAWVHGAWGLPLGVGLLGVTLGALSLRALRSRDYRPPLVGLAGAAALLAGKFGSDAPPLLYAGAAALLCASLWSVRLAPRRAAP